MRGRKTPSAVARSAAATRFEPWFHRGSRMKVFVSGANSRFAKTSFLWPLLKLFLSAFAWAAPAAPTPLTPDARFARLRRACHLVPAARVDLLDGLDKLGKWGAVHPIACLVFVALNHLAGTRHRVRRAAFWKLK